MYEAVEFNSVDGAVMYKKAERTRETLPDCVNTICLPGGYSNCNPRNTGLAFLRHLLF